MFGLGFWEIAVILGVALIIFGPAKLPELARSLGRGLREFRKATDDFKRTIDTEMYAAEPEPERKPATPAPEPLASTVARPAPFGPSTPPEEKVEEAQIEPDAPQDTPGSEAPAEASPAAASVDASAASDPSSSEPEGAAADLLEDEPASKKPV